MSETTRGGLDIETFTRLADRLCRAYDFTAIMDMEVKDGERAFQHWSAAHMLLMHSDDLVSGRPDPDRFLDERLDRHIQMRKAQVAAGILPPPASTAEDPS